MHPYLGIILFAVIMTVGSAAVAAAIVSGPPTEPGSTDARWAVAIVAALLTVAAVAAIVVAVTE